MFSGLGRVLILAGGFLLLLGLVFTFLSRIPFLGRLPGDLLIERGNVTVYIPLTTSILLSILLTFLLNLFLRR